MARDLRFTVPAEQEPALVAFLQQNRPTKDALIDGIRRIPAKGQIVEFATDLTRIVPLPEEDALKLLRMFASLYTAMDKARMEIPPFVARVVEAIQATDIPHQLPVKLDWEEVAQDLRAILGLHKTLGITSKALSILQEHERTFHDARVLTDIRPVFEAGSEGPPEAFVVVHELKIAYYEGQQLRHFYVALEAQDLQVLMGQVKRAMNKEGLIRPMLTQGNLTVLRTQGE